MAIDLNGVLQRTPVYAGGALRSLGSMFGRVPAVIFSLLAEASDFLMIQGAALAANALVQNGEGMSLAGIFGANAVGLACYFSFLRGGMYEIRAMRNAAPLIRTVLVRWSVLCLLLALSAMLLHHSGQRARLWLLLFYCTGLAGFCFQRLIIAWLVRRWLAQGNYVHAIGVIGSGALAQQVAQHLAGNAVDQKLVGLFSGAAEGTRADGVCEVLERAGRNQIDTVIIAEPELPAEQLLALVQRLRQQPLRIYLVPGPIALEPLCRGARGNQLFYGLNLFPLVDRPINEISFLIKGALDRLAAAFLLLLMAPVMLGCAAGIRLAGPGPILFRQKRIGYKGGDFTIFKFRTMHVSERPNVELTAKNDPRVFRFGMLLRKTSLDELPQLLNVLRGEMSLVGPRPHMAQATAAGRLYFDVVSNYAARHRVKPGITGWAQVNGWRGPTETVEQIKARVAHDLYYIENWSLVLDFTIMLRTCGVLFGKNVF